jgi:hypothetical protein
MLSNRADTTVTGQGRTHQMTVRQPTDRPIT